MYMLYVNMKSPLQNLQNIQCSKLPNPINAKFTASAKLKYLTLIITKHIKALADQRCLQTIEEALHNT